LTARRDSTPHASRFRAPDTAVLLFGITILAAVGTWIVPPGRYERTEITVEGVGTREVVVAGTFQFIEGGARGVFDAVAHSIGMIFKAPILGFTDPDVAPIIAFVLLIGGTFSVLQQTGAIDAALRRLVHASARWPLVELLLLPTFITLFSLGGAIFGMAEETVPFVLIFVPLALALGYDSIVGAAVPFVGSAAGFAAAFFNPFTVGVAQGIADLPLFSGAGFRVGLWAATTAITIAFVVLYARRIQRTPLRSPMHSVDEAKRTSRAAMAADAPALTTRQRAVLLLFFGGIAALVWGVLPPSRGGLGWYIVEIAALFVALGVIIGAVGGLGANGTALAFTDGIRQLAATAVIIGVARGILVVLQDGQVVDTILHGVATALDGLNRTGAAMAMFAAQTGINFFVVSGSGQAALTMPLMSPLADLLGVTRQTAVLAYQMGDGFTNMIIPTNPVLMGVLSLAGVPWSVWARWVLPLQIALFVLGLVALAIAVATGYGA
jgi:uncharacterized ion transporter superfamily protein YfcC